MVVLVMTIHQLQLIVYVKMDIRENFVKMVGRFLEWNYDFLLLFFCLIEYFQCQANGRFMDQYNCEQGKYFECIHHGQGMNFDFFLLKIFLL
jgi:hypothetical protein